MIVMTPVTEDGRSEARFGKAHWVAIAEVVDAKVTSWQVHEVAWDVSHGSGQHGAHHARVMRFLKENRVEAVVAAEMGPGMSRMLYSAELAVLPASPGEAKASVLAALASPERRPWKPQQVIQLGESGPAQ